MLLMWKFQETIIILGSANFLPPYDGGITFKNIKTGEEIFHKLDTGATRMFKS